MSDENTPSISDFLERPHYINNITEEQLGHFEPRIRPMVDKLKRLLELITSFTPPTSTLDNIKYRLWGERLYEIRFAFYSWRQLYNHEIQIIPTPDN